MKPDLCRPILATLLLFALAALPAGAADPPASSSPNTAVKAQLIHELGEARQMTIALADRLPEESYNWRPHERMRTPGEMLLLTARVNFTLPGNWGVKPPAELVLCGNYLDQGKLEKAKVIDLVKKSFDHAGQAIAGVPDADFLKIAVVDNRRATPYEDILTLVTTAHQNLGRLIDYALLKGIIPPWMGGWSSSGP